MSARAPGSPLTSSPPYLSLEGCHPAGEGGLAVAQAGDVHLADGLARSLHQVGPALLQIRQVGLAGVGRRHL